ncbi:MAG: class I SAM-dependent methyltransferase [Gammaproteobacteria bacterium]|nr:class I SAM-dependent methyltransferase [Gammaproteobacteria bacterium]
MKVLIPWWLKIIAKIVLSRVPVDYSFWQNLGLFRHGYMDDSDYVVKVFNMHVFRAGLEGKLQGKTILELGPGDSVATVIVAACFGAKSILIDAGPFAKSGLDDYHKLVVYLEQNGLNPPDILASATLDDILAVCNAQYLTGGLESFASIQDNTVDFIFSQAVLEHVRKSEFFDTVSECSRVLSSDGIASHRVDLKDHLGGGANNLRISSKHWEADWMSSSGFYTNRIRFKEMLTIFKKAGFNVDVSCKDEWKDAPIARKSLAKEFRGIDDDDLLVSGFDVLLKPVDSFKIET